MKFIRKEVHFQKWKGAESWSSLECEGEQPILGHIGPFNNYIIKDKCNLCLKNRLFSKLSFATWLFGTQNASFPARNTIINQTSFDTALVKIYLNDKINNNSNSDLGTEGQPRSNCLQTLQLFVLSESPQTLPFSFSNSCCAVCPIFSWAAGL